MPTSALSEQQVLPAEPRSAQVARRLVRRMLEQAGAPHLTEATELAVSELVTNAVVHAGGDVHLTVRCDPHLVRVEVGDASTHRPVPRSWTTTSGTGRGLHLLTDYVDAWDVEIHPGVGKTVWFEIGATTATSGHGEATASDHGLDGVLEVELLEVPLLMHRAWQEHATGLLREHLLLRLETDPQALDDHAAASDALSLLHEQLPLPRLFREDDVLMAEAVEPGVTRGRLLLQVPVASVPHFAVLASTLGSALAHAREGHLLAPPTQPEIERMRDWLCGEVLGQAQGATPNPWVSTGVDLAGPSPSPLLGRESVARLAASAPVLVADERLDVVGVSAEVATFLGYDDPSLLVGRRVLTIVPHRFHQAHVAGTTMHGANGRDVLLGRLVEVPVLRADGSEALVHFEISAQRLESGERVFVACFELPAPVV